jgi:predicted metalloprotease
VLLLLSVLTVLSFAFALSACGGGGDDDDDRDDDSRPSDSDRDGVRDSRDDCDDEKEDEGVWGSDPNDGCPGTIEDLVELARADIDFFWQQQFENDSTLYEPPLNFTGYTTEIETDCGLATLDNAFYCSADHSIYYDLNVLARELESNGDFGPVLIIAHEWGHLVQSLLGILGSTELLTIQTELQADCLAGVWSADADQRGLLEEGDLEEGVITLFRVGDPRGTDFFDPQAHGQPAERIQAFQDGFDLGLDGCTLD